MHADARVEPGASLGRGTRVWAFAHILGGARIGSDCNICDHVFVENDVVVGDQVTIKSGVQLWDGVRLADRVFVGPNATFTNDPFPRSRQGQVRDGDHFETTTVEEGASIGGNATILPGRRIGAGAMVGAGAVVVSDVPAGAVVVGNPARIVGWAEGAGPTGDENDRVPFLDLRAIHRELEPSFAEGLSRVLASGRYLLGDELDSFEREFAQYVGARECVCVGSGLDALVLSLRALGIGPGDDVLVPSNTFIATWLAVAAVGARPVAVEPDPRTFNVTASAVEARLTTSARAVIPVHLYGQPVDMDPILDLAAAHDIVVLFDAAQAHGARYRGRPIGALGAASAWSFYPGKNLGALGDGGAVTTDDPSLAAELRQLRNYGSSEKYIHPVVGTNSRLDEFQAAVLRSKLARLDGWNTRRRQQADRYLAELGGIDGLLLPEIAPATDPVWHLFVVQTSERTALQSHLRNRGVETLIHYPVPPYRQGAFSDHEVSMDVSLSDRLHDEVLSLPIGPHLTDDQVDRVCAAVVEFFQE